jgi:hypothetical protein
MKTKRWMNNDPLPPEPRLDALMAVLAAAGNLGQVPFQKP